MPHEPRVTSRKDPATVFRQEGSLGDDVQPGKQRQSFIQHGAHHVRVPLGAEELQGQQAPQGAGGGHCLGAGQAALADDAVEADGGQRRKKEKQAAEFAANGSRLQAQGPHVGRIGRRGFGARRALLVHAPWQFGEALLLEHRPHGHGAASDPVFLQRLADVVDGQVLLSQADDVFTHRIGRLGSARRWLDEELAVGGFAELMHQLVNAARGISELPSDFRARQAIDEIRPQHFVLPVRGVLGNEEGLSRIHLAHRLSEKGCFHGLRRAHRRAVLRRGSSGNRQISQETRRFLRVSQRPAWRRRQDVTGWKYILSAKQYPRALWRKCRGKWALSPRILRPVRVCGNPG